MDSLIESYRLRIREKLEAVNPASYMTESGMDVSLFLSAGYEWAKNGKPGIGELIELSKTKWWAWEMCREAHIMGLKNNRQESMDEALLHWVNKALAGRIRKPAGGTRPDAAARWALKLLIANIIDECLPRDASNYRGGGMKEWNELETLIPKYKGGNASNDTACSVMAEELNRLKVKYPSKKGYEIWSETKVRDIYVWMLEMYENDVGVN